jgi:hypothetical protein
VNSYYSSSGLFSINFNFIKPLYRKCTYLFKIQKAKLRSVAKLIQTKYGNSTPEALLSIDKNFFMMKTRVTTITIIITRAKKIWCKPKNTIDQSAFKTRCRANNLSASVLFLLRGFIKIKYREIPIKEYKIVHTGANRKFGGLKYGWFNVSYQVGIAFKVKTVPITPAAWQISIEIINFEILLDITSAYTFDNL